ncbi:hypothetical protein Atai01_25320 [Amycolatopsis taiwanensis]|uniref:Uncharacterized protein n=1 Tax=Amycolatopsis taiwanensis TaxID=342230 RepID=A0A9W6QY79_9PSEU|nr:hypothetical protein Atai01_25320 [Amycolatopsis taiwanensis]
MEITKWSPRACPLPMSDPFMPNFDSNGSLIRPWGGGAVKAVLAAATTDARRWFAWIRRRPPQPAPSMLAGDET